MLWLKNYTNCPPGEFYFKQAEAGSRTFGPSPLIGTVVSDVSQFRQGNNLPRSSQRECFEDVVRFTVARLPSNSEWIIETNADVGSLIANPSAGCSGCGAVVT